MKPGLPSLSPVGAGLWAIGGMHWGPCDDDESIAAIHAARERGVTLFDTAPVYGFGHSEEVLGRALAALGREADDLVVATKCGLRWDDRGRVRHDNRPETVALELRESLRRLGRDAIDLYQVHWPDPEVPIEETLGALELAREQGLVVRIGACNLDADGLARAVEVAAVTTHQVPYNLLRRGVEARLLPAARELGVDTIAYEPLCRGLFTGHWGEGDRPRKRDLRRRDPRFRGDDYQRRIALVEALRPVASDFGVTLAQLAIAFAGACGGFTSVLVGVRTTEQVVANMTQVDVDAPALRAAVMEVIEGGGWSAIDE